MQQLDGKTMGEGKILALFCPKVTTWSTTCSTSQMWCQEERITVIVLRGLPRDYELVELNAEKHPDFGVSKRSSSHRNMYINLSNRAGSRSSVRDSGMVVISSNSRNRDAKLIGNFCAQKGHRVSYCFRINSRRRTSRKTIPDRSPATTTVQGSGLATTKILDSAVKQR